MFCAPNLAQKFVIYNSIILIHCNLIKDVIARPVFKELRACNRHCLARMKVLLLKKKFKACFQKKRLAYFDNQAHPLMAIRGTLLAIIDYEIYKRNPCLNTQLNTITQVRALERHQRARTPTTLQQPWLMLEQPHIAPTVTYTLSILL